MDFAIFPYLVVFKIKAKIIPEKKQKIIPDENSNIYS